MKTESGALAIFGGTFNPVHIGHISIAESAKRELGYDNILFIPSSIPAHKNADRETSAADRIAMIELAVSGIDYIHIETCEIERGGISYMIDTVDYLDAHYRFRGNPGLIIGDDLLEGFSKWRRVDELVKRVDLIIAKRIFVKEQVFNYPHTYLNNSLVKAASRDIRDKVANNECIDEYVPVEVSRFIARHRLYRNS